MKKIIIDGKEVNVSDERFEELKKEFLTPTPIGELPVGSRIRFNDGFEGRVINTRGLVKGKFVDNGKAVLLTSGICKGEIATGYWTNYIEKGKYTVIDTEDDKW